MHRKGVPTLFGSSTQPAEVKLGEKVGRLKEIMEAGGEELGVDATCCFGTDTLGQAHIVATAARPVDSGGHMWQV